MSTHHPDDALLLDYAAGAAAQGPALLVATHLTFCPHCRRNLAAMEQVGAALMETLAPQPVSADARQRVMAMLEDEPRIESAAAPSPVTAITGGPALPRAVRELVGAEIGALAWQPVLSGVDQILIDQTPDGGRTRLMRIRAGRAVPRHTHRGTELVCVLDGGFSDVSGHYGPGDVAAADDAVDHQPTADADRDCICLAVTEAPVRLTGRFWRLLNPFVRF
ncbi:ChrR-like anti-ECFsigma factor [Stella humosa]|uniref:ChrR-like anti-ECFsigma factor n=1 Tax=Stella humosa TaxID=94 RepID=A0A3N1LJU4_9PROT|nr:ChrR family anti-sigma-E factor [Stella humosa]ROP91138.1 ChrR-like anti-ECFsigma factor [Stella humosa]BBK34510.1 anti-sigma factor [Stella humosa]